MDDNAVKSGVAIIGAGWAGFAAALQLKAARIPCTVFEATRSVGGRARRLDWNLPDGRTLTIDNGQHILLGAYRQTLALMRRLGIVEPQVLQRQPMSLYSVSGFAMLAPSWPAPFHVIVALLKAQGLSWPERIEVLRLMARMRWQGWCLAQDCSVKQWLSIYRQSPKTCRLLWHPLCVAMLNTPPAIASAQVFLKVLRDSLGGARDACDLLLPRVDLTSLFPQAAAQYLHDALVLGSRITRLSINDDVLTLYDRDNHVVGNYQSVIIATAAHHAAPLLRSVGDEQSARSCEQLKYQSITTAYLLYPPEISLPHAMLCLEENPEQACYGQWAFDRGQLDGHAGLIAIVISADGAHRTLENAHLLKALQRQLSEQLAMQTLPFATRLVVEKRATFACTVNVDRPTVQTSRPQLVLAGDYTACDYPATLESAVRSGQQAADALIKFFREKKQP